MSDSAHLVEGFCDIKIHTSVIGIASRTKVTQTYYNNKPEAIADLKYTFPIFDGACIVSFRCCVDDRVIEGVIKERGAAKIEFEEAKTRGQSAALLEQHECASDTFTTSIGNVKAGSTVTIKLEYLLELQNDMQEDGIRITIPSQIAPRYADSSISSQARCGDIKALLDRRGTEIIVDITMGHDSVIQGIQSKGTHPISIALGKTSQMSGQGHQANLASAYLKLDKDTALGDDVVLIVNAKDQGSPTAVLEKHSSIPGQRAIMATFVPKLKMAPSAPEVVFVIDRSGSMQDNISTLKKALRVFLKSLPVGIKFNLCGFGSDYSFLWDASRTYDEASLQEAERYVNSMKADMGGTQILKPLQAAVERRLKDLCLDVLLLTDGEVWNQSPLFNFIGATSSSQPVRFFSLGVGATVSHSLIQGVARAGGGFAQTVTLREDLDRKVLRMLKGALTEHVTDFCAKIECADHDPESVGEDDDFVMIDKPAVKIDDQVLDKTDDKYGSTTLYDPNFVEENAIQIPSTEIPRLSRPHILQVPYKLPGLFPFSRTTIYMLLSPESSHLKPSGIHIMGNSRSGP
ncbi:hypothetical protein KEM56_001281 [Ascosphaera pollenicola]|nr:hypothetical protein KEM56_001281 [Ascosphaera pollenicola]